MTDLTSERLDEIEVREKLRLAVCEAMQDAWNDICDDTGCIPLDITRHGRKTGFSPRHWADATALMLEPFVLALARRAIGARENVLEEAAIAARDAICAVDWPPDDGDRLIDEVMAAIRDLRSTEGGGK